MPFELAPDRSTQFPAVPDHPLTSSEYTRLKKNMQSRLSANTVRAYETALRQWKTWAVSQQRPWYPARPEHVALWLSELADRGLRSETLKMKLKAISYVHKEWAAVDPAAAPVVKDAIRAVPGHRVKKAAPLDEDSFRLMLDYANTRRDKALLLTMRWLMLRPSEASALRWDDIEWDRNLIYIPKSKTDQRGEGVHMHLPPQVSRALEKWRAQQRRYTGSVFNLTPGSVSRVIRRIGQRCGLEGVSGHSLRRGMACDLVMRGEGLAEIMVAGRWESPKMVARYAEEVAATGALARYAKEQNQDADTGTTE